MKSSNFIIKLTKEQVDELQSIINKHTTPRQIFLRAQIIVLANKSNKNKSISKTLNISRDMVEMWKQRWNSFHNKPDISTYKKLQDKERSGAPPKFLPEQICQLISIACSPPGKYDRPISHWTPRELADEMIKQNIVTFISARHVGRLLEEVDIKPHLLRYYLHSKKDEDFDVKTKDICAIYRHAANIKDEKSKVISCDEMCGIQATERIAPDKPIKPGSIERHEFEYKRHGTLSFIANFDVTTGQVIEPTIGLTRNEKDFMNHIQKTIDNNPSIEKWHFVLDNLNTHQSESLVNLVAKIEKIKDSQILGKKGVSGILQSMKTRSAFLSNPEHKVVFHYTPKHCSWLNQIEIWFSILVRKLLKRASFKSLDDLKERILAFIDYFNRTMAKPFKWTYKGKVLAN